MANKHEHATNETHAHAQHDQEVAEKKAAAKAQATVGRIVHYYKTGEGELGDPLPAVVYSVRDGQATLIGLLCSNLAPCNVPFSEEPKAGCWTWPPRV